MISLSELQGFLNALFPTIASDSSFNGLQIAGHPKIRSIATAVSVSLETIEQAIQLQADALVVHHGLFWDRDPPHLRGAKREKIKRLLEHDISLFAYHLPMDLHPSAGNNWRAAMDLGWHHLAPFGRFKGIPIGVQGRVDPMPRELFQTTLEAYYHHAATTVLAGPELVTSVALVAGAAYKSVSEAIEEGIHTFITGSFDEPIWIIAHEERVNFFALGHSATEQVGPRALAETLADHFQLPVHFLPSSNPF